MSHELSDPNPLEVAYLEGDPEATESLRDLEEIEVVELEQLEREEALSSDDQWTLDEIRRLRI